MLGNVLILSMSHQLSVLFYLSGFFSQTLTTHRTLGEGTGASFYSTLPLPPAHEHPDICFATLHVRWLSHIFNLTACIYQPAARGGLPPYRISIWLIDDVTLIFLYSLVDLIQGFCYSYLTLETSGLELLSTVILTLQANRYILGLLYVGFKMLLPLIKRTLGAF